MNSKTLEKIKNEWLVIFILLQPFLDMISYFQTKMFGHSYSWVIRIILFFMLGLITFFKTKEKKKLITIISVYIFYLMFHIMNLYRINQLSLILDIKYYILVFQMPIMAILLIFYVKATNYDLEKLKKAMAYNFIIIASSVFLAFITRTYEYTYVDIGIIGWFNGSNTPSMILCALAPWALHYFYKNNNTISCFVVALLVFLLLYFNATRACYFTLLLSLLVMIYCSLFEKEKKKKIFNTGILTIFLLLSIIFYGCSFTFSKGISADKNDKENQESIEMIKKSNIKGNDSLGIDDIDINEKNEVIAILKTSYIYDDLIKLHGEDKIYNIMKDKISNKSLSNNRLRKVINAKIEYDDSDMLTKLFGIGYSRIEKNHLDLENDFKAIFFYYGYIGFTIYLIFIVYMLYIMLKMFAKKFTLYKDQEYVILLFLSLLLLFGGEYTGAFLRKPNSSIYLSLIYLFSYIKYSPNSYQTSNKNKITFLLLHLGYGGIESATINSANALSNYYDVELISFYNLKENQIKLLNRNVNVRYLYDGEPNKKEIKNAIQNFNIIKIFREGFKAIDILYKKKFLIKKEIINSDSFAIVSTRVEFSILLSKYGRDDSIKIAQEHHHHNNNKKYINCLKYKYKNIDYLCALTKNLQKDYKKFLKKTNSTTKIILLPNMIVDSKSVISDLNNKNVISVGRLEEGKKIDELIMIFNSINIKNSQLFIIGSGSKENELKELVNKLDINDKVKFLGYLDSKQQQDYYLKSSVFAMTSITEGLPMVLLEAMQHGLPCIAYETDSGVNDIIRNAKNGYVIKNRNQTDYEKKLKSILSNKKVKKEMQKEALETAKKFNSDSVLKIWFNILKEYVK